MICHEKPEEDTPILSGPIWMKISDQEPISVFDIYDKGLQNNVYIVTKGNPIFSIFFPDKNNIKNGDILLYDGTYLSWQQAKCRLKLQDSSIMKWSPQKKDWKL